MHYTLGQARKALAGYNHMYGVVSVRDSINQAIHDLADMSGWECLRRVVRISSAGPCFALPQGCAGLVRVCVNGSPSTVRGQDFSFLHSGPGDLSIPPAGYGLVENRNVIDMGQKALYTEPTAPFRLFATTDALPATGSPTVTVRGTDADGRFVSETLVQNPEDDSSDSSSGMTEGSVEFVTVTDVVIGDGTAGYVSLHAVDVSTGAVVKVGLYNPEIPVPSFRSYLLAGIRPGQNVDILAEVRLDPVPLVNDTDVLPFDSLKPVEWMIMASWKLKSSEIDAAQKYQALAASWLKAKEVVDNTVQTSIVVNNVLEGSMGEVSADSWNV